MRNTRKRNHGEGLAAAERRGRDGQQGRLPEEPQGPTAGRSGHALTTPVGVPSERPRPRRHLAAVRTVAVSLRLSEPRRPHPRNGSDSHANGAGDSESEAQRTTATQGGVRRWRRGWHAGGCVTADERPPFLSTKGCEGYRPSWEERGKRDCPQGACWSLLLSAAVRARAPLEESSVGTGPLPALPDMILVLGRGGGRGRAQVLEPHLG